jgi:hypothetical protein
MAGNSITHYLRLALRQSGVDTHGDVGSELQDIDEYLKEQESKIASCERRLSDLEAGFHDRN